MINEFSVSPKPQNQKARSIMLVMFLLSGIIIATSFSLEKYRGVISSFSLLTLTVALLLYTKYISVKYYYEIMIDDDGVPLFLVRQSVGKRSSLLCRIELSSIVQVEKENAAMRKKHKKADDAFSYSYCPTLFPENTIRLYVVGYRAKSEIVIEGNDEFASLLIDYAKTAKEMSRQDEE